MTSFVSSFYFLFCTSPLLFRLPANRKNECEYQYSPLLDGWIRLLQLMPDSDEQASIRCRLIDYCLLDPEKGTHSYEALLYVWGQPDPGNPETAVLGWNGYLHITRNLDAALKRLRYCSAEQLLWIDSVCTNQKDN
ncbi:hypothetical protein B0H67DRAFT_91732 [Lasiosphaeris hirsuta]|uniref:Heterokaryon incompatibility domain-containing protein n=1 Tax=Lasiosphaeris hirsuta TaxID=260670 RepID=A0AA40EBB2_9PEZI|nr:hypothetical protein B0H67DRAFT_91732 [Lasiosphaeris hirsuta]